MTIETSAALNGADRGRLSIHRGIARCTLCALSHEPSGGYRDAQGALLYRAFFDSVRPEISVHDGAVEVVCGLLDKLRPGGAHIELSDALPWELAVHGGLSEVDARLADLRVERVVVRGGVHDVRLELGPTSHRVPIVIGGGSDTLTVLRPAGVPVRLEIDGGSTSVRIDTQRFDAIGGSATLVSAGFAESAPHYAIAIAGGAHHIVVEEAA